MGGEIADGQAATFGTVEQALAVRKPFPVGARSKDAAASRRIKQHYLFGEVTHKIHVDIIGPTCLNEFADAMARHLFQRIETDFQQFTTVDAHEIATDVHFQHEAWIFVALAFFQDMPSQAIDAVVRSPSPDATVTVLDEGALEHLVGVVEIEMVDDTVAEVGGKHLALLGIGDDEALGRQGLVGAVQQVVAK